MKKHPDNELQVDARSLKGTYITKTANILFPM